MEETPTTNTTNTLTKPSKHVVHSVLDGFPVTSTIYGKADVLTGLIQKLKAIGAQPPIVAPVQTSAAASTTPDGPPICPIHQTPMKPSAKPGGFFCSKKAKSGNGYCDQTA